MAPITLQKIIKSVAPKDGIELDLTVWSSIVAFSCLTPRATFRTLDGTSTTCDLYMAVVMSAGTGKSAMTIANLLLEKVHKMGIREYNRIMTLYDGLGPLPKPMSVILPSDITKARLIEHFQGQGKELPMILIETEMDSLLSAMKSEFGGFKSDLRKAFHNEHISSSKKVKNDLVHITNPRLSTLVSGTLNQARRFFSPMDDGFYSRFLIFFREIKLKWKIYTPDLKPVHHASLQKLALKHFHFFAGRKVKLDLRVAYPAVNKFGELHISEIVNGDEHRPELVTRHGLMLLKVIGILTCMRAVEEYNRGKILVPTTEDIELATKIANSSLEMSRELADRIEPARENSNVLFPEELPGFFKTEELLRTKRWGHFSKRTLQRQLNKLEQEGHIAKVGNGYKRAVKPHDGNIKNKETP